MNCNNMDAICYLQNIKVDIALDVENMEGEVMSERDRGDKGSGAYEVS